MAPVRLPRASSLTVRRRAATEPAAGGVPETPEYVDRDWLARRDRVPIPGAEILREGTPASATVVSAHQLGSTLRDLTGQRDAPAGRGDWPAVMLILEVQPSQGPSFATHVLYGLPPSGVQVPEPGLGLPVRVLQYPGRDPMVAVDWVAVDWSGGQPPR